MSSLQGCYRLFKNLAVRSRPLVRLRRSPADVRAVLRDLPSPADLAAFHRVQCADAVRLPQRAKLAALFAAVDVPLRDALRIVALLGHRGAALPPGTVTDLDLVKDALDRVAAAWKAFEVVAEDAELNEPGAMRLVMRHLRKVLRVAILLVRLAAPRHGEWTEAWDEALRRGLPGFKFDTEQTLRRGQIRHPSWASVLPPVDRIPLSYVPRSSRPNPLLVRSTLNGGGPVVVNQDALPRPGGGRRRRGGRGDDDDGLGDAVADGGDYGDLGYYNGGYY
jgi:hypothetical protein